MDFVHTDGCVSNIAVKEKGRVLAQYVEHLQGVVSQGGYEAHEASINLPADTAVLAEIQGLVSRFDLKKLKYVIVVGIGGSNLGTMAVYHALRGQLDALKNTSPKLIFAETTNYRLLEDIKGIIATLESKEELLVNIISKSGTTTETMVNAEVVVSALEETFGEARDRIVVTTDRDSVLWQKSQEMSIPILEIPRTVGGRYSVLSAVGLFPLSLAGVDVAGIVSGALGMRNTCLHKDIFLNPGLLSAVNIFLHKEKGLSIYNLFLFDPDLESLGKWYRQLMGESIGKQYDLEGREVRQGITPIVSIGSTDLHSMAQLYLGGPKDKLTSFVYAISDTSTVSVPHKRIFPDIVSDIDSKKTSEVLAAVLGGVKNAYRKAHLPFTEVVLSNVNEFSLGEFLQFKMFEMMYLAKLLNINAFDQPNVEEYKKETKAILSERGS